MRMWMVDPHVMCRRHLLGEHVELHMLVGTLRKGVSVKGYLENNLLEPLALQSRHAALAKEMRRRGYRHRSPLLTPDLIRLTPEERSTRIDRPRACADLLARCAECGAR